MKKIFTFLMALVMVLSATAMPTAKADRASMFETLSVVSKKDFVKQHHPATATMHKAPAATAATYNYVCTGYNAEDLTDESGDWYIMLVSNKDQFYFDIFATAIETGKTYTLADMDPDYTVVYLESMEDPVGATAASFTLTVDAEGLKHVVAQLVAGGDTYNLTYDEQPAVEHTWGAWAPFAPKGEATGTFSYNILGTWTLPSIDVQVRYATDVENLAQVKVSNWGAGNFSTYGVDFIFEWNTKDNTCVVPEQESGYNYSTYGMIMVSDVSVWQGIDYYDYYPCTYDPATATFSLSLVYRVSNGYFGYSGDTKGHVAETLVMDSPAAPVTGDTIRYTMTKNANWVDYAASQGWFQLYQNDGHYNVSISTANSPLTEGEFMNDDLDAGFTYIGIDGTKLVASNLHAILSKSGDVVTGTLWVTDKESGDVYEATLTHDPSKPLGMQYDEEDDVDWSFELADITQNSASGNSKITISFQARNETGVIALTLYASTKDDDIVIPEGEYTFASSKDAGTALISTGVSSTGTVSRSYLATVDEEGYLNLLWFLVEGKVTVKKVSIDGTPSLYLVVDGKNSWGASVKATVGSDPTPTSINNAGVSTKATKIVRNGQIVILRDGKEYNALGAEL